LKEIGSALGNTQKKVYTMLFHWRSGLMIYLGFKENKRPELIESDVMPTKETHPQYDFVYGPFKTREEASRYVKSMTGLACGEG
jgi:hypothetical protein